MKKLIGPIAAQVLTVLPGFERKGSLLYSDSGNGLLHGIAFESSDGPKGSFFTWIFCQPLYVPATCLFFTFGHRIGGGRKWIPTRNENDSLIAGVRMAIVDEAPPFFSRVSTPSAFASYIAGTIDAPFNPHVAQARVYSHIIAGDFSSAVAEMTKLEDMLRRIFEPDSWVSDMLREVARFARVFREDRDAARNLLIDSANETRRALGIPVRRPEQGGDQRHSR